MSHCRFASWSSMPSNTGTTGAWAELADSRLEKVLLFSRISRLVIHAVSWEQSSRWFISTRTMLWNLESRRVADIDNNVLRRRHFQDYLCYWCLVFEGLQIMVFLFCFSFCPRPHHHAEGFRTCLSDIVSRVSRFNRVLVFAYFTVHLNLFLLTPCPILMLLTWCVSP